MPDFTWGAAAASYQIEGRVTNDGRGECVWDLFCSEPGNVRNGHHGREACMHVEHFQQDVEIMASMGLDAYRLSVSWPRVIPDGTGSVNAKGLDFYDRLIDALLEKNITPWVTLFHWDYPLALYRQGGWLNPSSSDWFADYTRVVVDRLSDRVGHWMTLNEPQCFIHFGHHTGMHAPGLKLSFKDVLQAAHNALLAHGKSVQVIRQCAKSPSLVGAAPVGNVVIPDKPDAEVIAQARHRTFAITEKNTWSNSWFADPMILGHYPEDGMQLFADAMPDYPESDMDVIQQPLDFYGANIYTGSRIEKCSDGTFKTRVPTEVDGYTSMDWRVEPEALYWASRFYYDRYGLPIVITENGMANNDWVMLNGEVNDPQRIDYVHRHIKQFQLAAADGVPTKGYFLWSIMDNFEWQNGYDKRFGLVYVDYETQQRVLKSSAHWYRDFIKDQKKRPQIEAV